MAALPDADNGRMTDKNCRAAASRTSPRLPPSAWHESPQSLQTQRCSPITSASIFCIGFFLALACGSASAQTVETHPLTGGWTWAVPGKKCSETLTYRGNGTRAGSSGDELTEAEFQVTPVPSLLGFYRLTETLTSANGQRDCSGDLTAAGSEPTVRFIQFNPQKDFLIVCRTEALTACYGPLQRGRRAP